MDKKKLRTQNRSTAKKIIIEIVFNTNIIFSIFPYLMHVYFLLIT
jgi:hypothetical protein